MTAPNTQNYGNHRRFMPLYHFVAAPLLFLNILVAAYIFYRSPNWMTGWNLVLAFALAAGVVALRTSVLIVQNRLIRLEMLLRLRNLLPPDVYARASELKLRQLVGLRFASDAELPALVQRCLNGELQGSEQIKREIKDWQADTVRA